MLILLIKPIFILIEVALFAFTVFSNLIDVNSCIRLFVYIFPFIIFYEGLYFYDKEFNYAQVAKITLLLVVGINIKNTAILVFSLFVWIYSIIRFNTVCKFQYAAPWNKKRKCCKDYVTVFVNTFAFCICAYFYRKYFQYTISDKIIANITSWVITFISTDLIFNFTAMFILLQENFSKYNSVFLLRNIVGLKIIILGSIVPGLMIVSLCLGVIPQLYFLSVSIFCILFCLFCSVSLLLRLKNILSDTELLYLLMSKTSKKMFFLYKTNQLEASKNNIDTILRITTNAILNKQTDTLPDVLRIVLEWLEENKAFISSDSYSPYTINRFYYFMDVVTDSLISVSSQIIVKLYAEQVFYIFRKELEKTLFENKQVDLKIRLKELHLFYYSLCKLMRYYAAVKENGAVEILLGLAEVYKFNVNEIFLHLKPSDRHGVFVFESDDFNVFDYWYYEPFYEKVIDVAITHRNYDFLKHLFLFSDFYRIENGLFNNNHLQLLHKLTYIYSKILKECNYDKKILSSIFSDYWSLIHYTSCSKMDGFLSELIGNVVYNSIKDIYINLLKRKIQFSEHDFGILYKFYFDTRKILNKDSRFLNLFCFTVASYLDYTDIENNKFTINQIWSRLEQLGEIFLESNKTDLCNILNKNKCNIIEKHPLVQENYNKYRMTLENEMIEFQNALKKFEE